MTEPRTKTEARELLRDCVVPVILGHGAEAHMLALRLFLKYGVSSMICGRTRCLSDLLNPCCGFFRLYRESEGRLAAEQLSDLADGYGDCLFLLIPLREVDRRFVQRYAAVLESRFIVTDPKTVFRTPPFSGL